MNSPHTSIRTPQEHCNMSNKGRNREEKSSQDQVSYLFSRILKTGGLVLCFLLCFSLKGLCFCQFCYHFLKLLASFLKKKKKLYKFKIKFQFDFSVVCKRQQFHKSAWTEVGKKSHSLPEELSPMHLITRASQTGWLGIPT